MARVTLRMYATVREAAGSDRCYVDASDLLEVEAALLERHGDGFGAVIGSRRGAFDRVVLLVNGQVIGPEGIREVTLKDGDEVSVFPPISGG